MVTPLEDALVHVHRFSFTPAFRAAALPFGVVPGNCRVELIGPHLSVHFGPWSVSTPLANVNRAQVTGPYSWVKVIGPAHLSMVDRGLTFASNPHVGVCIGFVEPVTGIDPWGMLRHPGLTVTVADPDRLVADISAAIANVEDLERDERVVLEGQTAAELRALARRLGLVGVSARKKADLIDELLHHETLAAGALRTELAARGGLA